jgi:hypothetical protein
MVVTQAIDYERSPMAKHLAWLAFCGIGGGVLAPLCMLGGPVLMRAAYYTAGVAAGI